MAHGPLGSGRRGHAGMVSLLCMCFIIETCAAQSTTPSHIILRPQRSGKTDIALLIVPEINLENTAYEELGQVLQAECPFPLWIALVDAKTDVALTTDTLPLTLAEALQELNVQGMRLDTAEIFLAGHGHAGHLVTSHAYLSPDMYRGLILFGSYLRKGYKASTFPVPVLTLSGDLDGISRITKVADGFEDMENDAMTIDPKLLYQSPVVILEGFNHGVFSSGELPGSMQALDIDSEGLIEDGQRLVANSTGLFIAHTLQSPASFVDVARIQFRQAFQRAKEITEPIINIREMTQNAQFESYFIKLAQIWLSGLEGKHSQLLSVESYIVGEATVIPPTLMQEHDHTFVVTFSDVTTSRHRDVNLVHPQAPVEIAARMLGPERIQSSLENTTIARYYTCKDINYGSYLTAYHKASDKARLRFDNKHRGIIFHDDMLVQSDAAWEQSQLMVDTVGRVLHVTGVSYKTPNSNILGENAGLYYCKLLPPDRALEWIYVDSLRRNMPIR